MRRSLFALGTALACGFALVAVQCKATPAAPTPELPAPLDASVDGAFLAVPLPDPHIPGFRFPEPASTVEGWAASNDVDAMMAHAWGLWTALTMASGQSFEGLPLLTFETWLTLDDIQAAEPATRSPRPLGELAKLARGRARRERRADDPLRPFSNSSPGPTPRETAGEGEELGFVKFNPPAAEHLARYELLAPGALTALVVDSGQTSIPPLPADAITIKTIFATFSTTKPGPVGMDAGNPGAPYARFPVWTGPTSPPAASPSSSWKTCVWIDLRDPGDGPGVDEVDTICDPSGASRTLATTYGLGRFLHFTLSAPGGAEPQALTVGTQPDVGEVVVLAGVHVATRETAGWVWSTFFWTPSPDRPPSPSSPAIAAMRPSQLVGAPRGYASCGVLSMQLPAQPLEGGRSDGDSLYCYNPYLEAQFGPKELPESRPGTWEGAAVPNDVGSQSNCMACHAEASFPPPGKKAPSYTGDRYVDLGGPQFEGILKTDFLWSLPDTAEAP